MVRNKNRKKEPRWEQYNIDKLDSLITVALIADEKYIYIPKRLYKLAKQFMKVQNVKDLKIKTY